LIRIGFLVFRQNMLTFIKIWYELTSWVIQRRNRILENKWIFFAFLTFDFKNVKEVGHFVQEGAYVWVLNQNGANFANERILVYKECFFLKKFNFSVLSPVLRPSKVAHMYVLRAWGLGYRALLCFADFLGNYNFYLLVLIFLKGKK